MMQATSKLLTLALLLNGALSGVSQPTAGNLNTEANSDGGFLFDRETFGGNGRTCVTCHSKQTGTFSIEEAQARFEKDPGDPLFRPPDSDSGDGQTYARLLNTGTVRIDVPLASNVRLLADPTARKATFFRATPTVKNVTTLQPFLMSDGRESSGDLPLQALGAIHQHTQNSVEPTTDQLNQLAAFEQTNERFFSSGTLKHFARGGRPPELPSGNTPSERRGRQFFDPDRQCGFCHSGPMLDTSSDFDILIAPGSRFHAAGAGLQLGHLDEAFDADGNFILEPTSPNANQAFEFMLADGSRTVVVAPDPGQALITGNPLDAFNFKTSTLWGIKDTAPYFHDNSARTLQDVLDHYNRLFQFINDQIPDLFPLMDDQDQADILAFLRLL